MFIAVKIRPQFSCLNSLLSAILSRALKIKLCWFLARSRCDDTAEFVGKSRVGWLSLLRQVGFGLIFLSRTLVPPAVTGAAPGATVPFRRWLEAPRPGCTLPRGHPTCISQPHRCLHRTPRTLPRTPLLLTVETSLTGPRQSNPAPMLHEGLLRVPQWFKGQWHRGTPLPSPHYFWEDVWIGHHYPSVIQQHGGCLGTGRRSRERREEKKLQVKKEGN